MLMKQPQCLWLHIGLARPVDAQGRNTVVCEELPGSACSVDGEAMVVESMGGVEHVGFLARGTCREKHRLARYSDADREH